MIFNRNRRQWLRFQIMETMKVEYPNLMRRQRNLLTQLTDFFKARNQWWLILIIVFGGIYVSSRINYTMLNTITLDYKTATQLVDQRSSNLATIISISLVVVGFIINNLAIKEPVVYKILFRRTPLYLIVYLTLSTIAAFVITSTLRDTLDQEIFSKYVLAATYFVLLILLFIGILFRTIITITDPKKLNEMLREEILFESNKRLKRFLIWKLAQQRISSFMSENNVTDKHFLFAIGIPNNLVIDNTIEQRELSDIHFTRLKAFILKDTLGLHITNPSLSLGDFVQQRDELLWNNNSASVSQDRIELGRCIKLKKSPIIVDEFRGHFDTKFEDLVNKGSQRELGILMDTYLDLYEMEMINLVAP